jgi:hypothetical protein
LRGVLISVRGHFTDTREPVRGGIYRVAPRGERSMEISLRARSFEQGAVAVLVDRERRARIPAYAGAILVNAREGYPRHRLRSTRERLELPLARVTFCREDDTLRTIAHIIAIPEPRAARGAAKIMPLDSKTILRNDSIGRRSPNLVTITPAKSRSSRPSQSVQKSRDHAGR